MNRDGVERNKYRIKFRCPMASKKYGVSCENRDNSAVFGDESGPEAQIYFALFSQNSQFSNIEYG